MKRRDFLGALGSLVMLSPTVGLASESPPTTRIAGFRMTTDRDATHFAIALSNAAHYQVSTLSSPPRVVIDIDNVPEDPPRPQVVLAGTPVSDVRIGRHGTGIRVVLDMHDAVQPQASMAWDPAGKMELVVALPGSVAVPATAASKVAVATRPLVIAIDPGHGGKDPGAISANDHYEKYVAFSIATKLHDLLENDGRFKPTLTRDDDYFVPLHERVLIAHRRNADLFMSVHADAAPNRDARGASVYVLSEHGATSAMARWLAESENSADQYESLRDRALYNKDPELTKVLVDMSMDATILSSLDLGRTMIGSLGEVTRLHQHQVDQAGFAVLKSPDIPSILVETGFMSNSDDCRRLLTDAHQDVLAASLKSGIEDYFKRHPNGGLKT